MPVGLIEITMRLFGVKSLKEKRSLVRPILARLRHDFNCAVIESDAQDSHDVFVLSAVTINTSSIEMGITLDNIFKTVEHESSLPCDVTRRETFS